MNADTVVLELVGDVFGLLELHELRLALVPALRTAVPSDYTSLNEIGGNEVFSLTDPAIDPEYHETFAQLFDQNPLYQRLQRTRDGRAYRFSDVTTPAELHRTELYRRLYAPLGIEHQVAFTLPYNGERQIALTLNRCDRDFSDDERDLLNRARPYLIQAYRNAIAYTEQSRGPNTQLTGALIEHGGLTARQAEVVRLIALGSSNRAVADTLGMSERTVQKHLQQAYRTLGVHTRSDAAAAAWELARR
jgi:DNA-binding CsgD family transcriptional regulator